MFHRIEQINTPAPRREIEQYPKWMGDRTAANAAEESAILAARAAAAAAALAEKRTRPPSPAAVRMRRTRERRREGKLVIRWEVSAAQIEALALAGFLDPSKRDDAAEVARVIDLALDHLARSVQGATLGAQA